MPSIASKKRIKKSEDLYWSIPELCANLKIAESTARRYLTKGKLRRFKFGARTLILKQQALELVQEIEA
jgi:predicted site-specific integrase-resolvase